VASTENDPYTVLGLTPDASAEEIKRAYRRLALRYHPDVAENEAEASQFAPLRQAYETLSDPARRAVWDRQRLEQAAREREEHARASAPFRFGRGVRSAFDAAYGTLSDLFEPSSGAGRTNGAGTSPGHGKLRPRVLVRGDGVFEVVARLKPLEAKHGVSVPFVFHLGPRLIDEQLKVPPGARHGTQLVYRIEVGPDPQRPLPEDEEGQTLQLRVVLHVRVE
jgi:DnaJ-class molecular chaperone